MRESNVLTSVSILSLMALIVLIVCLYFNASDDGGINCTTTLSINAVGQTREIHSKTDVSIYADKQEGFMSQQGIIKVIPSGEAEKNYTINRVLYFSYDYNKFGDFFQLRKEKVIKAGDDNVPDEISRLIEGRGESPHIQLRRVNDDIYLIKGPHQTFLACRRKHSD